MSRLTLTATASLTLAALLPACVSASGSGDTPPAVSADAAVGASTSACDANAAGFAVGQAFTEALGKDMQAKSGAKTMRVLPFGGMATMDFREDRLTVSLDKAGKVERISCG